MNKLPKVTTETRDAFSASWGDNREMLMNICNVASESQPDLSAQVYKYIELRADTDAEVQKMLEVFAMTIGMLDSQAESDHLQKTFFNHE